MENFTPYSALAGGALIGLAAVLFMVLNGRIAGISGVLGGLVIPQAGDILWRVAFVAGIAVAPVLYHVAGGALPQISFHGSTVPLIVAGLLVGVGSQWGSGCTSGHGVCGISRFSRRSIVATAVFMAIAALTVFVTRHVF